MRAVTLLVLVAACGSTQGLVQAPTVGGAPKPKGEAEGSPASCRQSWRLEDAQASAAQVLVVCGADVRRASIEAGAMTRALDPGLDAARERVCDCAAHMALPAFVDVVVKA
ncbi:MAG TPA: hypothetical protein VKT18_00005, partial [Acidimicrobiales bacterium]|nr:hypothetical protein [Acidimicrobiales bacterium]